MALLPGPVNVVEIENGRVFVGHGDRFKTIYQPATRSFEEEVTDLESRYVVERRYTWDRLTLRKIRAVVISRK